MSPKTVIIQKLEVSHGVSPCVFTLSPELLYVVMQPEPDALILLDSGYVEH
jgi:hypothetical protein